MLRALGPTGTVTSARGGVAILAVGVAFYYLLRRRSNRSCHAAGVGYSPSSPSSSSSGWGLFTSPLSNGFAQPYPSTLVVIDGKVPVATKGPIAWLTGVPEDLFTECSLYTTVPVGSNAVAMDVPPGTSQAEALLSSRFPQGYKLASARELLFLLPVADRVTTAEVEAVVRAVSLLAWHRSAAFSGVDGSPTTFAPNTGGRRRKFGRSGRSLYPRVDPVAIVLCVSHDGEHVLLGRQSSYPKRMFTCVSGFVEHGESAEHAAAREVYEETGVSVGATELVGSQPWPCGRGSSCELMLAVVARAAPGGEAIDVSASAARGGGSSGSGSGELEEARWFDRAAVGRLLAAATSGGSGGEAFVPPPLAIAHALIAKWHGGALTVPLPPL